MPGPSLQDLISGFDPTGQGQIQGSDLLNMVQNATPAPDKGFVVNTMDIAGNPQVPNATVTPKWQQYLWRRITATGVLAYIWNPSKAFDAVLLYWDVIPLLSTIQASTAAGRILQEIEVVDYNTRAFVHGDVFASNIQLAGLTLQFAPVSSISRIFIEVYAPFAANIIAAVGSKYGKMILGLNINGAASAIAPWGFRANDDGYVVNQNMLLRYSYQNNTANITTLTVNAGWLSDWAGGAGPINVGAYNSDINQGTGALQPISIGTQGRIKMVEYL